MAPGRSRLLPSLRRAYRRTAYVMAAAEAPVPVRIGEPCPALDRAMAARGVAACAFITAWNPQSRMMPDFRNRATGHRLAQDLAERGIATLPYVAEADGGDWPAEEGLVAFGIGRRVALALGRAFRQNAILWCPAGGRPQLLACTEPERRTTSSRDGSI